MSELTREYLDKKLNKLATRDDIKGVKSLVQNEAVKLETRFDTKIESEIAELAGMVSRRFDEIEKRLDVRVEIDQLKIKMNKVWDVLNIKN